MSSAPNQAKPLLPTLLIVGLSTALTVGGFYHFKSLKSCQTIVSDLKAQLSDSISNPVADDEFLNDLLSNLEPVGNTHDESAPDNWVYGSPTARFTLIEMTDTECPYCKGHFPIIKGLVEASGGHINAALLHIPAHGEASGQQAAAIECAGEQGGSDAAWKYAGTVFNSTKGNGGGVPQSLVSIATKLGLEGKRFSACLDSVEATDRIKSDLEQALKLGIQQTPSTLILDNKTGKSLVLQGSNSNRDSILQNIESLTGNNGER